jgi:PAS domain S-box-containing protein
MMKSADQLSTTIDNIPALMGSWLAEGTAQDPERLEVLLPAGDQHLRQIVDGIPALITVTNAAGELEFVNRQVQEYFGKTVEELKSWATGDAIHPDDLPRLVTAWRQAVETGHPFECEHRQRRADGVYRWFHGRALPMRDPAGQIRRWHIFQTDVDERKRAESLLAAEKRSLEMINGGASLDDILNDLCASIDVQASEAISTIMVMEPERQRLWPAAGPRVPRSWHPPAMGWPIGPCHGCCGTAAYRKERVIISDVATDPLWPDELRELAIRNGIRAGWSEPILTNDGELLGTFALYSPKPRPPTPAEIEIITAAGHIALMAITRQRSREALRKSEDALRNAEANLARIARMTAMGELVASIGHEVNQPLMAIVTNADACLSWLASDKPQLDQARQAAERIVRDGHRAGDIIKSIRALAKKTTSEMTQLDINGVIEEVLVLMGGELRRHDIMLETELTTGLAPVVADRIQIQQVILNLVTNAIEAMSNITGRSRVLRLSTRPEGTGAVLMAVADMGTGLDQAAKDRIFEPFFTTKPDGMGMGLSICGSIVEAHGGRLWASPNLPYGSIFQFSLPVVTNRSASDYLW